MLYFCGREVEAVHAVEDMGDAAGEPAIGIKAAQTMAASDMMTEEAADEAASEGVYEYDAVAQNSDTGSGASTAENVQKQVEQGRKTNC